MALNNPFTPMFGEMPAHIAGRKQVIADVIRAFESEQRRPEISSILVGARGTGKTTLLSYFASCSEERGWIAVNTTARPGMLEDIEVQARRKAAHLLGAQPETHVSKIGIPQIVEVSTGRSNTPANWRSRIEDILNELSESNTGLLITVDEIDPKLDELVSLASIYQHFIRENRKVGLLLAGLSGKVSTLLSDKTVSFLRRSNTIMLEPIADQDIETAFRKTVVEGGREINNDALEEAVSAIGGFPFLMQLIGYRSWDENDTMSAITVQDVRHGIKKALADLETRILVPTYRELSNGDIAFLEAMLQDGKESLIADIVSRLGKSPSQVSQYRTRLIEAGIIGERRRGVVGFELPFFRDYLTKMVG